MILSVKYEGIRIEGVLTGGVTHEFPKVSYRRMFDPEQQVAVSDSGQFRIYTPARGRARILIATTKHFIRVVEIDATRITQNGRKVLSRKAIELKVELDKLACSPLLAELNALVLPIDETGVVIKVHDEIRPLFPLAEARIPLLTSPDQLAIQREGTNG